MSRSRTQTRNRGAKDERRKQGEERLAYWQGLSPQAQLNALDARLGKGVGAARQRVKLNEILAPVPKSGPVVIAGEGSVAEALLPQRQKKTKKSK